MLKVGRGFFLEEFLHHSGKKGKNGEKKFSFQGNEWDSNCMSAMSAFIKGEIIAHNWKKKTQANCIRAIPRGKTIYHVYW